SRTRASVRGKACVCFGRPPPTLRELLSAATEEALSGGADRTSGTLTTAATDPLVVAHGRLPTTNPRAVRDTGIDPHLIRAHLQTATAPNRAGNRRPNRLDSHATLDDRPSVRMLSLRKLPVTAVEPETYAESMCPIRPAAQRLTGCGKALVVAATDRE